VIDPPLLASEQGSENREVRRRFIGGGFADTWIALLLSMLAGIALALLDLHLHA
jgi:hypothetical protein